MKKQVILTGIRSNEDPQIGNYFGAMLPIIDLAKTKSDNYQINLFVPDLHSFTTPIDHTNLYQKTLSTLRTFIAAGLPIDNPNVHIYRQSFIPAHSELTVILNNFTYIGELSRMTQYKDKGHNKQNVSVGLFDYPVLMASDILLYGASFVPVGDDQSQHLELTRDLAQRFNTKFNQDIFIIPKPVKEQHNFFGKDQGLRIKDLVRPEKKMSKSDETGKGVIFLNDNPTVASKKILSATTDSVGKINYDPQNQPGISNLLQIQALLTGESLKNVINKYQNQTQYGALKKSVSDSVQQFLTDFQSKLSSVEDAKLNAKLESSEATMNEIANKTLLQVQKAVGLKKSL